MSEIKNYYIIIIIIIINFGSVVTIFLASTLITVIFDY